jgi:hypothetical protein
MYLGEIGLGDFDWIGLAQDRDKLRALVNAAMNLWILDNAGRFSGGCITSSFSTELVNTF